MVDWKESFLLNYHDVVQAFHYLYLIYLLHQIVHLDWNHHHHRLILVDQNSKIY
jgi:hypothetical protein